VATRIAGGELAARGMFPHQVALVVQLSGGDLVKCGGSLITQQFVLTAAHCLTDAIGARVYLGASRFADAEDASEELVVTHRDFTVHPGYLGFGGYNDLALIRLPREITTSERVQAIELAGEFMQQKFLEGKAVTLSGWGSLGDSPEKRSSRQLYYLDVEVIGQELCQCHFLPGLVSHRRHVCTDGASSRGACNGDSGGPLVLQFRNASYLIGVTSFGSAGGCELGAPTSVTVYLGSTKRTSAEVTHTVSSGSFIIHKDWDSSNLKNDIALIKIPAVAYSTKIAASKLPALASSYSTYAGDSAIASGWGRTSDASSSVSADLKFAIMTIITNAVCQGTYGSVVTGGNICVATTNGVSTCNGDSGGPLFLESNKEQVGLTSFGAAAGCQKGYPGSFTRVTYFRSWIKENTQI
ncbi:hypothetical protein KR009_009299, partial [Drosophila setifemur]